MSKRKILVVDNEVNIVRILEIILRRKGFDVKSVNSGAEAIEILNNDEFDIVLCDYFMPRVTGYDVAKFIKESGKRTKTGLITGWDELIKNKDKEEIGVEFVITKPFDFDELEKYLNKAVN